MKKFISCFLAALMILSCFGTVAFADNSGYTKSHLINLEEDTAKDITIVQVAYQEDAGKNPVAPVKDENGDLVVLDSLYVTDGNNFYFIVIPDNGVTLDFTSTLRAFSTTYYRDMVQGKREFDEQKTYSWYTDNNNNLTTDADAYGIIQRVQRAEEIDPATGERKGIDIFMIPKVNEDKTIFAYNISDGSLSTVKQGLLEAFEFFLNLIKWFFGLFGVDVPAVSEWGKGH